LRNRYGGLGTMKIQLWSYNYAPEPTGIAPVSTAWAKELHARGHEVTVVAAHPHYPTPKWGKSFRPRREVIDGITVIRLPLWIGRASGFQRVRQDASFALAMIAALPFLPKCDRVVAVSPSFPALAAAIINRAVRRVRWILWLQDILPDGATTTGMLEDGTLVRLSRKLELASYRSADRIAVISETFRENLLEKEVPNEKIVRVFNPPTLSAAVDAAPSVERIQGRVIVIGNIGHSQGLDRVVEAFGNSAPLEALGAELIITGTGVAADDVKAKITNDRVKMLGLLSEDELRSELAKASLALVTQRADIAEFNLPSKVTNYFDNGLPIFACVNPSSETASLIEQSDSGWVSSSGEMETFGERLASALEDSEVLKTRGAAGAEFARTKMSVGALAEAMIEAMA
jgi:colanic acid biosynthesis glycosyl transferase WcaI